MKVKMLFKTMALTLVGFAAALSVQAQGDKASRPSPAQTATGKVGNANITISYSAPSVKGRKIFGDLVPFDKVWRAGANEATIFETDSDIKIEGKNLPAGRYSLYAIPGESEWSFIFNAETGQWGIKRGGDTSKNAEKDVLTIKVKPKKSASMTEQLAYQINSSGFLLRWENVEVPVMIK